METKRLIGMETIVEHLIFGFSILIILLMLSIPTISAYSGGGGWTEPIPCEAWCDGTKPYNTICVNGECVSSQMDRELYYSELDGICIKHFDYTSDDYYECYSWWNNHYKTEINKNFDEINRNMAMVSGVMVIIALLIMLRRND